MWSNVIIGLLIPTGIIIYLFKKSQKLTLLLYPLGVTIAVGGCDWGDGYFWDVSPLNTQNPSLSSFPFNIGYFPLLATSFGYTKEKKITKTPLLIFIFTIITTLLELSAVLSGKVVYAHGWNIYFTFGIYIAGFIGTTCYINALKKYGILE
ncbi:CBO0543 family protein [Halobacillus rhizosphaerae]|uniref:CBO0543 family protein n=1 Tax=Halobacillus rhizosphaerae TaxID=3064889 RepID=UPI00398B9495